MYSIEISDKIASALLAMSLSYYYVMGEHVEKEARTDEILSTLLSCTQHKMYMNTTRQKKGKLLLLIGKYNDFNFYFQTAVQRRALLSLPSTSSYRAHYSISQEVLV